MLSALRNRFGIPGAISVIALVFAMTGGAFAAKYIITSTKQIKPSVLKALKGKAGPAGPQGPAGPAGKDGANGANGASVANSAEPKGLNCKEGGSKFVVGAGAATFACNGEKGKEGSPWTAGGTLPSGKTEAGVFASHGAGANGAVAEISFTIPLETAISGSNVHVVPFGGPVPTGCTGGTLADPKADTGQLCVYNGFFGEVGTIFDPAEGAPGAAKVGALLISTPATTDNELLAGTWAVTAP
jgi:hypothetical protein